MLGSEKSSGYCLELIRAEFLAGANLHEGDPAALALSLTRLLAVLSSDQRKAILLELVRN